VEDKDGGGRTPTINRIQSASILTDADYQQALTYSDGQARELYQAEAESINQIQKAALTVVQSEEPYDVFICYKETDASGQRSRDSVLVQELYQELLRNGIRPFFARVTLESKGGTEYEPIIFAALHSAQAMVVLGTAKEHFQAPWVRNEWSRYQALMKQHPEKKLYPVYRDMDAYDLPDEMSLLQAYDASRLGFMQDLVHGLKKVVDKDAGVADGRVVAAVGHQGTAAQAVSASAAAPLVKRARLMCEDGDFAKANELVEQALNLDPENGEVYLVALMSECQCRQEEELGNLDKPLPVGSNFQKILRFGDDVLKQRLEGYAAAAQANYDEQQRIKEEAEAARIREEQLVAAIMRSDEDFMNGKASDSPEGRQRLREVQAAISSLQAQEQSLYDQRRSFGLFAGSEKRQLDAQIALVQDQRLGFEQEAQALGGQQQQNGLTWRVIGLDEPSQRVLAITEDVIAKMPYHQPGGDITWEGCTLRRWLNGEFYNSLPAYIKPRVLEAVNQNPDNGSVSGGNPTRDRVFPLSVNEANRYFKGDKDRIARHNGTDNWWWLRSPGNLAGLACGNSVADDNLGVRPALWLNL
jgi:tetratricopeptide (TPR) repeat protein